MSIVVPALDLAPAVASRVVRIKVADMVEGPLDGGKHSMTFTLPGDLRVPADDVILRAGARTVELDANGEGQIRLPTHDADAIAEGIGSDWYLLESRSWSSEVRMIRIPSGTASISLADVNSVTEVTPAMGQWLLTGAAAQVVEGPAHDVSVSVAGGIANFKFTVPPGAPTAVVNLTATTDLDSLNSGVYLVPNGTVRDAIGFPVESGSSTGTLFYTKLSDGVRYALYQTPRGLWGKVRTASGWPVEWVQFNRNWYTGTTNLVGTAAIWERSFPDGAYSVWSGSEAVALGLPTNTQGILEAFGYGTAGAIRRWTTRATGGAKPQMFLRALNTDGAWGDWIELGGGSSTPPGKSSGVRTVPLAVTLGNAGTTDGPTSATVRYPLQFNAPITRWRLRIANRNARSGTGRTGNIVFQPIQVGVEGAAGAITSPQTAFPGFTTDGTGWVSPWSTVPIATGQRLLLSTSYVATAAPIMQVGAAFLGASASALALQDTAPFEVWIEAETPFSTPVVAVVGSSTDAGVGSTRPVVESVLSRWARANSALPVHYAHSGDSMGASLDAAAYKWSRWEGLDRPDMVLLALGSNDVYADVPLAELQDRHRKVAVIAATRVSPVQQGATVFRRASAEAAGRVAYNSWLTSGAGLRDVFDFAAAIGSPQTPGLDADGVHVNDAGHSALLAAITRPLTPPPVTRVVDNGLEVI